MNENLIEQTIEQATEYRRIFHRYPEPGWLTFFATAYIAAHLKGAGYELFLGKEIYEDGPLMDYPDMETLQSYEASAIETLEKFQITNASEWIHKMQHMPGLVGILDTGNPGPVKAFRFDMDALLTQESNDESRIPVMEGFQSTRSGVFHACGHDGHMAIGLAFAEWLAVTLDSENAVGKYILIFQPAEEGVRGAMAFCRHWKQKFGRIDRLYCCHIGFAPENTFVAGAKGFLATTKFDVFFQGKSAHAGLAPERGRNALLAAAKAVVDMQCFPRPKEGITRLNVGQMQAGESRNTIPAHAWLQIETRGDVSERNQYMKEAALGRIADAANLYQVDYEIQYQGESVNASSNQKLAQKVMELAKEIGDYETCLITKDFGASDDGAVFMDMVQREQGQAIYMLFGTDIRGLHHEAVFDFSEQVLGKAIRLYTRIAFLDE